MLSASKVSPNEYRRALEKLLSSKRTFALKDTKQPENVVDLMEALRKSVGRAGGGSVGRARPKKAAKTTRRAGRHSGEADMHRDVALAGGAALAAGLLLGYIAERLTRNARRHGRSRALPGGRRLLSAQ